MIRFMMLAGLVSAAVVPNVLAQKPPPVDKPTVTLTPPQTGADGKLVVVYPKAKLLEVLREAIPAAGVDLPDQKLGNQLIYRDVQLNKLKAVDLKPSSLTLEKDVIAVAGTPAVTGELNAKYEHVVIEPKLPPVIKSDWRPKGATPFEIKVEVRGTCKASFTGGDVVRDCRLRLETRADFVKITDVKVQTDDLLLTIVKESVAVVGKAFPNEGLNKKIKDELTRTVDTDPFAGLDAKDLEPLGRYKVKGVTVNTDAVQVTVTAALIPRP